MNISVVGLGYVGLPLAIQFARSNATVVGLDVDPVKVDMVNQGQSHMRHYLSGYDTGDAAELQRLCASTDFAGSRK